MKKNDKYEIEYEDQKEADKIIRKLTRAEIPDSAIDYSKEEDKLLVDSEYSDICEEVMRKYTALRERKEQRETKAEVLEG